MDLNSFWPEYKGAINLNNSPTNVTKTPMSRAEWNEFVEQAGTKAQSATVSASGRKDDGDKLRMDLLDPVALEGLSAVLTFGAKKYAPDNWRGGIAYRRLIGALFRHGFAFLRGEDLDPESGLPHIDHLGACWMFLSYMSKQRKDLDDRPK